MAKSIMVLGTMSNVGKSVIAGALCRVFTQDGYNTVPFKSQNMALNSFITKDGLEMGRAQVMQAECAGKEPDVRMNPILIKPVSDQRSQVILNGEVVGNMSAADYYKYKKNLIPDVLKTFHELSQENDIIVIEGAGSPAEINLMSDDIVNMGLAVKTNSPCVLVGDIDRGGVFASLYGTVKLLGEDAKNIKGIIINKFRGDIKILEPGLRQIEELTGIPVLGVVPYEILNIDDEDSLSERFDNKNTEAGLIDIAVMRLPRISNFTDFNPFENLEGVSLRYVGSTKDFKNPDLVIIPGTKNTIDDLKWLRQTGLESQILKHADKGKGVIGICGGYQMLGHTLTDAENVETGEDISGMGLLDCDTVFMTEKTRTRVKGKIGTVEGLFKSLSNEEFEGYEIHMGDTVKNSDEVHPLANLSGIDSTRKIDGLYKNNILGSYVHGFFDKGNIVWAIIQDLCAQKGISIDEIKTFDMDQYKEREYDKLADILRNALDMDKVYDILNGKEVH